MKPSQEYINELNDGSSKNRIAYRRYRNLQESAVALEKRAAELREKSNVQLQELDAFDPEDVLSKMYRDYLRYVAFKGNALESMYPRRVENRDTWRTNGRPVQKIVHADANFLTLEFLVQARIRTRDETPTFELVTVEVPTEWFTNKALFMKKMEQAHSEDKRKIYLSNKAPSKARRVVKRAGGNTSLLDHFDSLGSGENMNRNRLVILCGMMDFASMKQLSYPHYALNALFDFAEHRKVALTTGHVEKLLIDPLLNKSNDDESDFDSFLSYYIDILHYLTFDKMRPRK